MIAPAIVKHRQKTGLTYRLAAAFTLLAALSSCGKDKNQSIQVGKTTAAQLTQALGPADRTTVASARPQAQFLAYQDGHTYQVESGLVVVHNRPPLPHEETLQYWRHLWKGEAQIYGPIEGMKGPHGSVEYELRVPEKRKAVVYNIDAGRVTQVTEYGVK